MSKPTTRSLLRLVCGLLLLVLAVCPSDLSAQKPSTHHPESKASQEETRLAAYFDTTLAEIQEIITEQKEISTRVEATLETLNQKTVLLKQELLHIKGMAKIVKGRPYETRGILQDLRALHKQAKIIRDPAETLYKELKTRQEKIALLSTETGQGWTKDLPEALQSSLEGLKTSLSLATRQLQNQQKTISKALEKSQSFTDETLEALNFVEKALPAFWKHHLFTSSGQLLSRDQWQGAAAGIRDWINDIPTFLKIQLPASSFEWVDWCGKVLFYWTLQLVIVAIVSRKTRIFLRPTNIKENTGIFSAWLWVSLSLALMGAFFTTEQRQTSLQLSLIYLSMFYGLMRITWAGRHVEKHAAGSSPLTPFFALFAGAALLQLLGLPHPLPRILWIICLGISFSMIRRQSPTFMLEKGLKRIHPTICTALFLLSFFGWPQLSLLLAEIWALLALFLQLALVSSRLLGSSVERLPATLPMTIIKGLLIGFGSPLLWVLCLSGTVGWLSIHLGSDFVFQRISTMNLSWGEYSLNFFRIAVIIVLFYLTHAFGNIWGQILDKKYFRWSRIDPGIIASLRTIGGYAIWIISGIVAINIMGIQMTSLAVIAGGLSVGIGFGLQNLINNFISGLILLFGRTIQAGDVIQIDDLWGTVRTINIRNTEIQTFDNSIMFVPNSELISNRLINWTHRGDYRLRRDLVVGVAYGSNIDLVKENLSRVAKDNPHVLETPSPSILFKAFGASSLDFTLRVWIDHIDYALTTLSELHEAINKAFAEAGIEISFPQMDLHLRDAVPVQVHSPDQSTHQ